MEWNEIGIGMDTTVGLILIGSVIIGALYSAGLQRIHDYYTPDWIWVTVVGGNALIGLTFALFCHLGYIPWIAFWLLVVINMAYGTPIILWQTGQMIARGKQRQERER